MGGEADLPCPDLTFLGRAQRDLGGEAEAGGRRAPVPGDRVRRDGDRAQGGRQDGRHLLPQTGGPSWQCQRDVTGCADVVPVTSSRGVLMWTWGRLRGEGGVMAFRCC